MFRDVSWFRFWVVVRKLPAVFVLIFRLVFRCPFWYFLQTSEKCESYETITNTKQQIQATASAKSKRTDHIYNQKKRHENDDETLMRF